MMLVSISALITILLIMFLILKGYYLTLTLWLGGVFGLLVLGWGATIFIKPRYPEWWERHIAVTIDRDLMRI